MHDMALDRDDCYKVRIPEQKKNHFCFAINGFYFIFMDFNLF